MRERRNKNKLFHKRKIDDETKIYNADEILEQEEVVDKRNKKNKETKKKHFKFLRKHKKPIIIILILLIVITAVLFGIKAHKWKTLVTDMSTQKNSIIIDTNGEEVAKIGSDKKKIYKASSEIPQKLRDAYVSIEDERFYEHSGVDLKRTVAAIGSYIIHFGKSDYGGSTITQQLVKNLTGDSQSSVGRKITEWFRATQIESFMSKSEVMDLYLNIIYTGPNIYGVGAGANYYFNTNVENLDLAQCAFLAGINHSPNSYNPFTEDNSEKIKKRTIIVLDKMKELKYITEEEYNSAKSEVKNGLDFSKGEIQSGDGVFSYHSDSVLNKVISDIEKNYNISETFATNYIEMSGLKIYSTMDSNVQSEIESECEKSKYNIDSNGETSQAAMAIIEPSTGKVLGCVGGLGEKTEARSLNRATQSVRQTGSSIKPLAVLTPAIDKKIITASTICDDTQRDFGNGYSPRDFGNSLGKITVRRALESSQNIPFVEIMQKVTPSTSMQYLEKMGINTLTKNDKNLGLALGGLEQGITPLQMAAAYNTIANDGEYIEPIFYTKVEDINGNVRVKSSQKKTRVISKAVAFILKQLLTQPVEGTNGTATYCHIDGVDVAAKTGTTDEDYDKWLCGFTPYYTAACWFGYDQNQTIYFNSKNPAGLIWANVMSRLHSGKESKRFEMPSGWFDNVVSYNVCAETGKIARSGCEHTYTEYYLSDNVPDFCDVHGGSETGKTTSQYSDKIKETTNKIIQNIKSEIDAVDPQELERTRNETVSTMVQSTGTNSKPETNTRTDKTNTTTEKSTNTTSDTNTVKEPEVEEENTTSENTTNTTQEENTTETDNETTSESNTNETDN